MQEAQQVQQEPHQALQVVQALQVQEAQQVQQEPHQALQVEQALQEEQVLLVVPALLVE